MQPIDRVVYGDNQFFGINHRSQAKAREQTERFKTQKAITDVYERAIACGVNAIMLNSNDRVGGICDWFRERRADYGHLNWYPSIPYPHKYANLVTEKGVVRAMIEVLLRRNSAFGLAELMVKGAGLAFGSREIRLMKLLVDLEMRPFQGLNVKVVFLQNVVVDLLLGLGLIEVLGEYCRYIHRRFGALPGLITQNLPRLKSELAKHGIERVVICASINKAGYLMSPNREAYVEALRGNDPQKYAVMAMSVLASGAISAEEAFAFVNELPIQSIVFGASSEANIRSSLALASGHHSAFAANSQ